MDADTFARLSRFKGRIIAFEITDIQQTIYFFPDQNGIQIMSHYEDEADTVISGTLFAFARMAMSDEQAKTRAVFKGDVTIRGDISLGQHFQALFKQLDIDWEEHLSHFTGDVIAHSLGNMARGFLDWGKNSMESLALDSSEFIQYETRDIASTPEVDDFLAQVDQIRNDIERAQARVQRLIDTIHSPT